MTGCRSLALVILLILLAGAAYGQVDSSGQGEDTSGTTLSDTPRPLTEGFHPTKSSLLAVGLSLVLPGSGQIYNEDYWKAPVIWALAAYWVYEHDKTNNLYHDFGGRYSASITTADPVGNEQLKGLRDFYRDERDKFSWYLGALYFLNLLDAYVGANLYDFNVTPDLSLDGRVGGRVSASIRVKF